jgi:phosphoribosylformylglycinamidine synthase
VGPFTPALVGSELAKLRGERVGGDLPEPDLAAVRAAHVAVRDAVRAGHVTSAHDIAEGGLAVAVAEACIAGGLGARVEVPEGLELFGEAPGTGFVVSGPRDVLAQAGWPIVGEVGGDELELVGRLKLAVSELRQAREHGLAGIL